MYVTYCRPFCFPAECSGDSVLGINAVVLFVMINGRAGDTLVPYWLLSCGIEQDGVECQAIS